MDHQCKNCEGVDPGSCATHPRPESDIERAARVNEANTQQCSTPGCQHRVPKLPAYVCTDCAVEATAPPKGVWLSEEEASTVVTFIQLVIDGHRESPLKAHTREVVRTIRARLEASRG